MDIGERVTALETHYGHLSTRQQHHEDECVRYRQQAAAQLEAIEGKVDTTHDALHALTVTLRVWQSAGAIAWTIATGSAAAALGWIANALAKYWGWL